MAHPLARPGLCRRRLLALRLAGAALLGGCGFHLRQPVALPFSRVALTGFAPHSPMADAVRRALPARTRVVEAPSEAEVVVAALNDQFVKTVVASTTSGQVREFRLRVTLRFRLTAADGQPLSADTELEQQRDLSYTESAALAKEAEEAFLVGEMRNDMAQQLMQMLHALGAAPRR
jgi:LPS-assembly lipoprotein